MIYLRHQHEIDASVGERKLVCGALLVTRVDAASDPGRIGSDQVRRVRFEGERMVLVPPSRRTGETEEHREITWERIAAEMALRLRCLIAKTANSSV